MTLYEQESNDGNTIWQYAITRSGQWYGRARYRDLNNQWNEWIKIHPVGLIHATVRVAAETR